MAPTLPYRRISRMSGEFHLTGMILIERALPQQFDRSIVLIVVMRVCAPDWTAGGRLHRPAEPTRFTSANAIATSLKRSPETIRRHVQALVADGLCIRGPGGITLNPDPGVAPDLLRLYADYHDLLAGFVADVAALGLLPQPTRAPDSALLGAMIHAALDMSLIPFEHFGRLIEDWTSMRVWSCMGTLNVRHVTCDPVLSERYAVASTPDTVRHPVPLRQIERVLGVPYATAWRHCRLLETRGLATQTDTGWLVRVAQLRDEAVEEQVVAAVLYYLRRMTTLVAAGLDPARIGDAYLNGRLPLVPMM